MNLGLCAYACVRITTVDEQQHVESGPVLCAPAQAKGGLQTNWLDTTKGLVPQVRPPVDTFVRCAAHKRRARGVQQRGGGTRRQGRGEEST